MLIKKTAPLPGGYCSIVSTQGVHSEIGLDFGLLTLKESESYRCKLPTERAFMLMDGSVEFRWEGRSEQATRTSLLEESPWALHLPSGMEVEIRCISEEAELCLEGVKNPTDFEPALYTPEDIRSDIFGEGTMQETSTRTVRTVFDGASAPWSEMVLGEVVNHPGKWSSYPPHDHPHPEIYHYRLFPSQGFGVSILEDGAEIVHNGDTALITPHKVHPQIAAPGYAMYYIWMIPHLKDNKFKPDSRIFRTEHTWLMSKDARIWPDSMGN